MTAVQQPPDTGLHWDASNMVDSDLEEFEDDESNSAKLFERSRIRALAGMFRGCKTSLSFPTGLQKPNIDFVTFILWILLQLIDMRS